MSCKNCFSTLKIEELRFDSTVLLLQNYMAHYMISNVDCTRQNGKPIRGMQGLTQHEIENDEKRLHYCVHDPKLIAPASLLTQFLFRHYFDWSIENKELFE